VEEGVSYETLQELLRSERRSNRLTPLANVFWARLQAFLSDIEAEFRAAQAKDPFDRRVMMLTDRVKNARHAAEAVWTLRERKIAMLALAHVRDGGKPEGLTEKEKTLYAQMADALRAGRRDIFAGTAAADDWDQPRAAPPSASSPSPSATPAALASAPVATGRVRPGSEDAPVPGRRPSAQPRAAEAPAVTAGAGAGEAVRPTVRVPADSPDAEVVVIRALAAVPPFVGPDMNTYILKEGDVASVPAGIANLLVKRGKAAVIQIA
jgi:DNA replication initiation complex subunit (GINS family)